MQPASAIDVRDAVPADLGQIAPWLDDPSNPLWRQADLQRSLQAPAYRLVVATHAAAGSQGSQANGAPGAAGTAVAGFALLRAVGCEWSLLYLLVNPRCRRTGIAQALLLSLQRDIAQQGGALQLEVRESNQAALALYSKLGFVEQGRRSRYYEPLATGGAREDALLLAWAGNSGSNNPPATRSTL